MSHAWVQQAGPVGRGSQARVEEEGTGSMLLCVLVLFTFIGGLKSSLKGLYGHLLGHTYFKNNFLLLLQDNSCVTPGEVWGSSLGGSRGEPEALTHLLPCKGGKDAMALSQVPPREGLGPLQAELLP